MPPSAFDGALLGETMAPADAVAAGYLDRVVPADDVLAEATAEATRLSALRRGAVDGSKQRARGEIARRALDGIEADMGSITSPS
jgi:enoyl-CoA hydratase/carnithine racemase